MKKFLLLYFCLLFTKISFANDVQILTIHTYDSFMSKWGPADKITQAFESRCNCQLKWVGSADGVTILNRLKVENSQSKADIILGLDNNLIEEAINTNLFKKYTSNNRANIDLPIAWTNEYFTPFDYGQFAFVYNKNKIPKVPKNMQDIIDDNISIIYQDPRTSTPGLGLLLWIKAHYQDNAREIWQALNKNTITITKSWSEAYSLFLQGESDMVLSYVTSPAYHEIVEQDDSYTFAQFEEGHYLQIEVAGILNSSKNPILAEQFIDFILTTEFQQHIPENNWMLPVINGHSFLKSNFIKLNLSTNLIFDSKHINENKALWISEWLDTL